MKKETKEKIFRFLQGPVCPKCKDIRMNIYNVDYIECPICNYRRLKK